MLPLDSPFPDTLRPRFPRPLHCPLAPGQQEHESGPDEVVLPPTPRQNPFATHRRVREGPTVRTLPEWDLIHVPPQSRRTVLVPTPPTPRCPPWTEPPDT